MDETKLCQNCLSRQDKIQKIIAIEWAMFDCVNKGKSRASCQDDPDTFLIMRQSQFEAWSDELLDSYLSDLLTADGKGINLVELKYLFMMCGRNLDEMIATSRYHSAEACQLIKKIMNMINGWTMQLIRNFPQLKYCSRPLRSIADSDTETSMETYQKSELYTYSEETIRLFYQYVLKLSEEKKNLPHMIVRNTALLNRQAQEV
ncbi:MAG: DUF4125 family protein [Eubacterium sp.]|nr:DUF4125 family protein [Eubacterium sp.]